MNEELRNKILAKPLSKKGRGDHKRKRDDADPSSPALAQKGSTSYPIQLDEEETLPSDPGAREPSPDLPMVESGGDGDRGTIPGRRRLRRAILASSAVSTTVDSSAVRPPTLLSKPPAKSKGKEVQSAGADVTWKSGQSVEAFVEEIQQEVRKDAPHFLPLMKDPKYFQYWMKQLTKSVYTAALVGMANAQGGDLEEKLLEQVQKTSEEAAKVAKLEKDLEAGQVEVAMCRSTLEAVKLELDELKPRHTDLVVKADALASDLAAARKSKTEAMSALWGLQSKHRDLERTKADLEGQLEGANQLLAEKDKAIEAEGTSLRQSGYDIGFDEGYEEARLEMLDRFAQAFPDLDPARIDPSKGGEPTAEEVPPAPRTDDAPKSPARASTGDGGPTPTTVVVQDPPPTTGTQDVVVATEVPPVVTGEEQAGDNVA